VLWPAMCIYGLASGWLAEHLLQDMQLYFGVWVVIGLLYNLYARWHNPEQQVNPLLVGALGMWFIADSFVITLVALCTFDVGEWGAPGTSAKKGDEGRSDAIAYVSDLRGTKRLR